jgi:glycogen debranching enzyme
LGHRRARAISGCFCSTEIMHASSWSALSFRGRLAIIAFLLLTPAALGQETMRPLELLRPIRSWEFLPVAGTRAGLLGDETGRLEAWVYPLKIFRQFHLRFLVGGRALPAESLARTLTVRPESATITYGGDNFSVRETLFVPVHEAGAVIAFDVQTAEPLEIEVAFTADFQLEWPAALGATFVSWEPERKAFVFGEEQKKFAALVASPTASDPHSAYAANYSSSDENSFRLGLIQKGHESRLIAVAASVNGLADAQGTYQKLVSSYPELLRESAEYYRKYLEQTVGVTIPDARLQQAYDWSRVSVLQGLVTNPYLGTGLVAGYRTSGTSQRPGFAWYFGRDSMWTSFALNAEGDYGTTRTALEFISKYQRDDGKLPHEIAQGANFVDWFKSYPFPYAAADATPLFLISVNDYVRQSGDVEFARQKWDQLWKAYQFLRSTWDAQGLPQNFGVGHGWVEGGPLLPVMTEFYQSGLGLEALRSLANLAGVLGKDDVRRDLEQRFAQQQSKFEEAFWSPEKKMYAFALDRENHRVDEKSVLTTVPMWFGLLQADRANVMLRSLAAPDITADWGTRIISTNSVHYNGSGYHFGSVWPLFTGWASVGAYRYHANAAGYANLRANALLALDGSLGHVTEVLSGDTFESLSTASPHQIWSAAMVVSPMLRGLFGLQSDAIAKRLEIAPHLPADWNSFALTNVRVGGATVDLRYSRSPESISLETKATDNCSIAFSPAVSLRAGVLGAEWNGRPIPFKVIPNSQDQHIEILLPVTTVPGTLRIRLKNDFALTYSNDLPALGSASEGLRVLSESWNSPHTQLTVSVAGLPGKHYDLAMRGAEQVVSVTGGSLQRTTADAGMLRVDFPATGSMEYVNREIVLNFGKSR